MFVFGYYYKGLFMNIKVCILSVIACSLFFVAQADRQKVYSIIKQKKSKEWYSEQASLWKSYLETHQDDSDAWLNYYTAVRMKRICGAQISQRDLDNIVKDIEKNVPNSFEYHYITFWNADINTLDENFFHIQKAYELAPKRADVYDEFVTYYELKRDKTRLKEVSKKWFASNDMPPSLYYWNYNVLQSLEREAILITSGDNDTYPAWVLQYAKNIRTDVNVLNHSMLGVDDYRNRYFAELGIPKMPFNVKSFETYPEFQTAMMKFIKKNTSRPIYFAISAQPGLYKEFKNDVYNVGMAYKWSDEKFDNIAVIKKNYEKNYLIDYLRFNPVNHIGNGVVEHMDANYLISMLPLYNHYEESDDMRKNDVKYLINKIAKNNGMEGKVAKILGRSNNGVVSYVISDPRKLEHDMVKVKEGFYASATEVSNSMYDLFLSDLLKQKRYVDLNIAKANAVDWRSLLSEEYKSLKDDEIFPHGHPDAPNAPVVNISYDAAKLYCEWLTSVYNGLKHKRKRYGEVVFRLPTEEEWEYIALGGKKESAYAWGGPYIRNAKGCFLANIKADSEDGIPKGGKVKLSKADQCAMDGAAFPVNVESYFPNDYGLYNITGNVSEMITKEGVVKGGSWNTPAGLATIKNKEKIATPSPQVGFRVVMVTK